MENRGQQQGSLMGGMDPAPGNDAHQRLNQLAQERYKKAYAELGEREQMAVNLAAASAEGEKQRMEQEFSDRPGAAGTTEKNPTPGRVDMGTMPDKERRELASAANK